ncbi:MAG: type VI secretion system baseplate subunit TssG [Spirochaetaceae bacterium]|jgi:type VI secretion system protein ImpH|nr:type VI secretion system baseplate subunit TssG [Spirochaetaceae bacterium]
MEDIRRLITRASGALRTGKSAPDFWGLTRALENAKPSMPRFGHAKHPAEENVRFGQMPFLHFPGADIADVLIGGPREAEATIIQYFFGLLGVNGPMPLEFTNYVFQRSHNEFDHTWRRFLDIIHHRMTMFFYRSDAMYQQSISFDRHEDDPFSAIIKSLAGVSPDEKVEKNRQIITLNFARQLSFVVRNKSNMEDMLRQLLGARLTVRDFVPSRHDIPHDCRAVLGNRRTARLGVNMQIGRRFKSRSQRFEIHIGPIDFYFYQNIVSGFTGLDMLTRAVKHFLDRPLEYNLVFKLNSATIPQARLGFDWADTGADAAQLGYTCWIGSFTQKETVLVLDSSQLSATGAFCPSPLV